MNNSDRILSGYTKLTSGRIPEEEELAALYCFADSIPKGVIPKFAREEKMRDWLNCSPQIRCAGLLRAYHHLIRGADDNPEISTYIIFKRLTKDKKIGITGTRALEEFLESFSISEWSIDEYISAHACRN